MDDDKRNKEWGEKKVQRRNSDILFEGKRFLRVWISIKGTDARIFTIVPKYNLHASFAPIFQ